MRKRVFVFSVLFIILASSIILAEDRALVDKAYTCLEGKVSGKCSSLNLEEQSFSLLALAYKSSIQSECKSSILALSDSKGCWPKAGCKLRDTALATLALNYAGQDTTPSENWLLNQTKTPTDILWFLEVDASDATSCTVKYDTSNSTSTTILMSSDKKLSLSGSGACLSLANGGYWLQISPSCLSKTFRISCDKDFSTALVYKKSNSDIWYVSSKTQQAGAGTETSNQAVSQCFAQGGDCNYEGSLWAALALQSKTSITPFLPYLISSAPDNQQYSPYAFLNRIAATTEFESTLKGVQNPAGFWDIGSGYGRNYDTALSVLGLAANSGDSEVQAARDWLQTVQGSDGCWASTKDTAFILYSAWRKDAATGGGGTVSVDYCTQHNYFCMSSQECGDAGGQLLDNFACEDGVSICCSKDVQKQLCSDKGGITCSSDKTCSGSLVSAQDTDRCCVDGTCTTPVTPGCEINHFTCKSTCSSTEEVKSGTENDCPNNQICCGPVTKSTSYWWIWILVILIVLAVVAIIFRNQLRVFFFKFKNKGGKPSPVQQTRPPFPPSSFSRPGPSFPRAMPRPTPQQAQARPQASRSKTDSELDETLKKLKEMSK